MISAIFTILAPPHDIRVGANVNEEMVVDFKPAISTERVTVSKIAFQS
jgi:hypothetical protein